MLIEHIYICVRNTHEHVVAWWLTNTIALLIWVGPLVIGGVITTPLDEDLGSVYQGLISSMISMYLMVCDYQLRFTFSLLSCVKTTQCSLIRLLFFFHFGISDSENRRNSFLVEGSSKMINPHIMLGIIQICNILYA